MSLLNDEYLDLDIELSPAKKSPTKGRRAEISSSFGEDNEKKEVRKDSVPEDYFEDILGLSINDTPPVAPRRSRKAAVWTRNQSISSPEKSLRDSSFDRETPKINLSPDPADSIDNDYIPVIPDLDDVQSEEFTAQIAEAPKIAVNKVMSYNELDVDLLNHAAFSSMNNVDLGFLAKFISSESDLALEDDVPRSWEMLFTDVMSAITSDLEDEDTEPEDS